LSIGFGAIFSRLLTSELQRKDVNVYSNLRMSSLPLLFLIPLRVPDFIGGCCRRRIYHRSRWRPALLPEVRAGKPCVIIPLHIFLYEPFKNIGKTTVFYDVRNRGRPSRVEDTSTITLPQDVRDLETMRQHFGVKKISFIGYSYAGMMVMLYTRERHFGAYFESIKKLDISREAVAKVSQPVLTIHGRKDRNTPYGAGKEWATVLPNGRLITLPNAAHNSWVDEPRVVEMVQSFLAGGWPKEAEKPAARGVCAGLF
jgi:pimeloyl-ACP methyl ester carboxylesterase